METEWECRGRARSHHVCVMLWVFNGSLFSVWTLGVWDITMVSPFIKVSVCGGWERFTAVAEAACCTWLLGSSESLGKTPRWQQYYHGILGVKGHAVFPHLWIDSLVMWPVADVRFFFLLNATSFVRVLATSFLFGLFCQYAAASSRCT